MNDRSRILATAAACAFAGSVTVARAADDLDSLQLLSQRDFRLLSEDLGAALSYKPLIPAEPLGVTGFDIGLGLTSSRLENTAIFDRATSTGNFPSTLWIPTLRAHKGLPFGVDIGAMYANVPSTNFGLWGAEVRWALLQGSFATPALALRGAFTRLSGVEQLNLRTSSLDLSISKGFLNITPYAGIGRVWTNARPDGVPTLAKESFSDSRVFAGVNVNLLINFVLELDRTGDVTTYGLKAGIRF
jgi:hypothetical protein